MQCFKYRLKFNSHAGGVTCNLRRRLFSVKTIYVYFATFWLFYRILSLNDHFIRHFCLNFTVYGLHRDYPPMQELMSFQTLIVKNFLSGNGAAISRQSANFPQAYRFKIYPEFQLPASPSLSFRLKFSFEHVILGL